MPDLQRRRRPRAMRPSLLMPKWFKLQQAEKAVDKAELAEAQKLTDDPANFFRQAMGFEPTAYQKELIELFQNNQFVAARWARQTGKSFIISALLLWYALTNQNSYIAVVGPSWRQAKLVIRKIASFVRKLPSGMVSKCLKTVIYFENGSMIEAFPNSPETIRGPSLNCLPSYVKVTLSNGSKIPISEVKPGQEVLSYNMETHQIESKKILRVFVNPLAGRRLVRFFHDFGYLDCTEDHKIFTLNRGYVPAIDLRGKDKSLYLDSKIKYKVGAKNKIALQVEANRNPRTIRLRWASGRFMSAQTKRRKEECLSYNKSFLKTSRVRSIQIFDIKKFGGNPAKANKKQRVGQRTGTLSHSLSSFIYRNLCSLLSRWAKNYFRRVVKAGQLFLCFGNLVHGRWFLRERHENKHSKIFQRGTSNSSTVATNSLGNRKQNNTAQARFLSDVSRKGTRQVLRLNQTTYYSKHAIQGSSRVKTSALRDMWQISSPKQNGYLKWQTSCLPSPQMQINVSQAKSGLEAETIKSMRSLRGCLHANTRKDKDMFICLPKSLETSTKKTSKIEKQEDAGLSPMPSMRTCIQPFKWSPKNLQYGMSQRTPQKILEDPIIPNSEVVYDLEVKDNHNFFANEILVSNCVYWDEACLTPDDEELYDAILFTLGATGGKFICSSTPWRRDSIFYKIFHDEAFKDFAVSHVTWEQAVEPYGPLKRSILEKIRNQYAEDPWRWRREMEAEWAEDESTWLSQDLITRCIATEKTLGYELELWDPDDAHKGVELYAGLDLGKHRDFSVLTVIERVKDVFLLRYVKIFPLETPYATVIGWVKTLQDRWGGFQKIRVDMTGVGDYIVEDMTNAGIENIEGVLFTQFRKQEMASLIKERMKNKQFYFPYFEFNLPYYRSSFVAELHMERFELTKDGSIKFNHPAGSKDDVFWAVALALAATVEMGPEPYLAILPR